MNEPNDYQIIEAMIRFGGGFASALGKAAQVADSENLRTIKTSFPEIWEQHKQLATHYEKEQHNGTASS